MLRRKINISLYAPPLNLPPFFHEGLRWAQERDREFARLRTLTLASVEEAGGLQRASSFALDVLVHRLAAGDREPWAWVEERLAEMREPAEEALRDMRKRS